MPGREPMNPRGRQFALGGTASSWVRLTTPTAAQKRILRRCYAGLEPRALSRYGVRQWAAPWPPTRLIVKDPFAVLSIESVCRVTDAVPVLVYRHPGAVLASYRRMGWAADSAEVEALGAPTPRRPDDTAAMAAFWTFCYRTALADMDRLGRGVVVSHERLAVGSDGPLHALMSELGLALPRSATQGRAGTARAGDTQPHASSGRSLHDFDRDPDELHTGWRSSIDKDELEWLETQTRATRADLDTWSRRSIAGYPENSVTKERS